MMPFCQGIGCEKVAVFLGPNENPAYCKDHLDKLVARLADWMDNRKDPPAADKNSDFQIENADIEGRLKDIGKTIAGVLPDGYGFNLLIFNFGEGGATFYISNAERESMLDAMKEFIDKQEKK